MAGMRVHARGAHLGLSGDADICASLGEQEANASASWREAV